MTPQAVRDLEMREAEGKVTLTALGNAARSLNMKLVYAIVPVGCTVSDLIRIQAKRIAEEAIRRTSVSMSLEDQAIGRAEVLHDIDRKSTRLNSSHKPISYAVFCLKKKKKNKKQ